MTAEKKWLCWMPFFTFLAVFAGHAFYIRKLAAVPTDGWADVGVGFPPVSG